jgi:hypothetical protein
MVCSLCSRTAGKQGHSRAVGVNSGSDVPTVSIEYASVNEDGEDRKKRKERDALGEETGEGEQRHADGCRI